MSKFKTILEWIDNEYDNPVKREMVKDYICNLVQEIKKKDDAFILKNNLLAKEQLKNKY